MPTDPTTGHETRGWQPIATYGADPLDPHPVVLRPHRIYGVMDVRRLTDDERKSLRASDPTFALQRDIEWSWVNGDYTTMWTEDAFLPFWMPRPDPPASPGPVPA